MPSGYPKLPTSRPLTEKAIIQTRRGANWEYSEEKALAVIEAIAGGDLLKNVLKQRGISPRTWQWWVSQNNELSKAYITARQLSAYSMEDDALEAGLKLRDTAETVTAPAVAAYRAFMEQLRWSAARRNPAEYGDKQVVSMKVPIQINTTLNLNGDGSEEIPDIYTVDLEAQPKLEFNPDGHHANDKPRTGGRGVRGPVPEETNDGPPQTEEKPVR